MGRTKGRPRRMLHRNSKSRHKSLPKDHLEATAKAAMGKMPASANMPKPARKKTPSPEPEDKASASPPVASGSDETERPRRFAREFISTLEPGDWVRIWYENGDKEVFGGVGCITKILRSGEVFWIRWAYDLDDLKDQLESKGRGADIDIKKWAQQKAEEMLEGGDYILTDHFDPIRPGHMDMKVDVTFAHSNTRGDPWHIWVPRFFELVRWGHNFNGRVKDIDRMIHDCSSEVVEMLCAKDEATGKPEERTKGGST